MSASLQRDGSVTYLRSELGTAAPHGHTVQFYDSDEGLVGVVASFLAEGLAADESVVVIATPPHLREFRRALEARGIDLAAAAREGRLVSRPAEDTLAEFIVDRRPDPGRFRSTLEPILCAARAASPAGNVRVYGEMVNVLWEDGNVAATAEVEHLWSELIGGRPVSLLCGYHLAGFPDPEHGASFRDICTHHTSVGPTERYTSLSSNEEKLARIAELEQRAQALEQEIQRRRRLETEHARLLHAERLARAEVTLLYGLTDAASRAETLEQVYETALDGIATALGVDRASILLFDSDGVMRFKAWHGLSDGYRAAVEGHTPWRPDDRDPKPVLSEDVRVDERVSRFLPLFAREGIGALGFFPLCHGGRLLGELMVYYAGAHAFTDAEVRLARAIADQVGSAVDRTLATLERERLLGIVGHDLRNPLNAITMSTGSLLRHDLSDAVTRSVRRIVTSADRMERLIRQLLHFAQARQGSGIPLHVQRSDLGGVARRVVDELDAAHPDREVILHLEGDLEGEWDGDRLAEALSNLVGNAIQHGGGATVSVRVQGRGGEVVAEVHNAGDPIPAAVLPHVFDPFRRGSPGSERSQSVGLGLFITREIVRAHGGTIEARSTAADGTTFSVRLPRTPPHRR